jgi:hypothetical protein
MSLNSVVCAGGLNTDYSLMNLKPGEAVALVNVEVDSSGCYTTMRGIEPFDGRPEPNKAKYLIIGLYRLDGIAVGDLVVATPSGGYATVIGIDGEDPNNRRIAVMKLGGAPITLDDKIAGNQVRELPADVGARGYLEHKRYLRNAANILRAPIAAVPGVGHVRGVVGYKNELYAFRDHSDNTTCRMYKATGAGWTEVATSGYLLKGGRYEFSVHNFTASAGTDKLIIVNGVNKGLLYDGTTFTQISTAMPVDNPSSVEVLPSDVLLLGYENGSLMASGPGTPLDFSAGVGAEIGCSDKIVGLALQPDERCAIFCESSIHILSGKTKASFSKSVFNDGVGAIRGSVTNVGDSVFLTRSGLTRLSRVQSYGDFAMTSLDEKFRSAVSKTDVLFSIPVRDKNQYRIFSTRGFVGVTFIGSKIMGAFTGNYPVIMRCGCSAVVNGEEYILLGGEDGFVYRADVGTSHAGEPYTRLIRFAHNHLGNPQQRKRFKRLTINAECERMESMSVFAEIDFSSGDAPRQNPFDIQIGGSESYFGSAVFGESVFGVADDAINQVYLVGVGRAIAPILICNSDEADPVRVGGYLIEHDVRAKAR